MSTASPTPAQAPFFQCHFSGCNRTYRRKEHLTRHARRHFHTISFACPFCEKSFARNDTLRQHVRGHHKDKEKELSSSRSSRACSYCRSRKSRCHGDGRGPCEACSARGIECSLQNQMVRSLASSSPPHRYADRIESNRSYQHTAEEHCALPTRLNLGSSPGLGLSSDLAEKSLRRRNQTYIQVYFDKFHPHWPFLHQATFDLDHEPAFLLQSVVMMGLWVVGDEDSQGAARKLHESLSMSIWQQRDKWSSTTQPSQQQEYPEDISHWPMATYQGILLHIIFALLASSKDTVNVQLTRTLPALTTRLLVALVHTCLYRKMFSYPSMLAQFTSSDSAHLPEVYVWLGIEEVKRFSLALYKVCRFCRVQVDETTSTTPLLDRGMDMARTSSTSTPRSSREAHSTSSKSQSQGADRCLLSLSDLQFAQPDSDGLWHALSDLAARVAESRSAYSEKNAPANWISQSAHLLQPSQGGFQWI
ncbi:hypothetical protein BDW66DRAFT_159161 [Aspergillus desertorum]